MGFEIPYHLIIQYVRYLNLNLCIETNEHFNFRCPLCGDSESKPNKKSAYILGIRTTTPNFYCHKCSTSKSLISFIKEVNYSIYLELIKDLKTSELQMFEPTPKEVTIKSQTISSEPDKFSSHMLPISFLEKDHEAVQYLENRNIPKTHYKNLYFFIGNPYSLFKDIFNKDVYPDKSRREITYKGIIVPYVNHENNPVGLSMRMYKSKNNFRFLKLVLDQRIDFLLGEDKVDWNKPVIIVEGMFDKLSFKSKQVLAMESINTRIDYVLSKARNKVFYVFDNEMKNKNVYRNMLTLSEKNVKVFLWKHFFEDCKDMNDVFKLEKYSEEYIIKHIIKNSYSGLDLLCEMERNMNHIKSKQQYYGGNNE